jgi:GntR family transcriptional repressor for pyruvate dehydrogenase complex
MYTPVQSGRLYEQIVEQIEERILSGELRDGDRLPTERELTEQFEVSRTAVREAINALVQRGLVEAHPGRGTFVRYGTSQAVRHSLGLMMRIGQAGKLANLVEIREILEPEIAALAASRATEQHIATMQEAVEAMDAALDDADAFIKADDRFHLALAEGTQNPLILTLIDPIVGLLHEQRKRISFMSSGLERGQYHHKRILEAIVRHDPEAAREAMRAHLRQVREDSEAAVAIEE